MIDDDRFLFDFCFSLPTLSHLGKRLIFKTRCIFCGMDIIYKVSVIIVSCLIFVFVFPYQRYLILVKD